MLSPSDAPFENIIFHFSSLLTTTLIASHSVPHSSIDSIRLSHKYANTSLLVMDESCITSSLLGKLEMSKN